MKSKKVNIGFILGIMLITAIMLISAMPAAAAVNIPGAIFTSLGDGSGVNINLYNDKCDAFLNGGPPPNAPCDKGPAGLPDGCYVYQVTAPPGGGQNEKLLSQDSINRRFAKVSGGVFVYDDGTCAAAAAGLTDCVHPVIDDDSCEDTNYGFVNNTSSGLAGHDAGLGKCSTANISVRLMPYADTPNNGGVYKVYATRIGDYDNTCSATGSVFGFVHAKSKTDNFRVKPSDEPPPPQQGSIDIFKFCDANANGILDPAELTAGLSGWQINFNPDPNNCSGLTDNLGILKCADLDKDTYTVSETVKAGFSHTATCADGFCGQCSVTTANLCNLDLDCPETETCVLNGPATASITITGGDAHYVDFGNVGLGTISGRKFYDANANGVDDSEQGMAGVKILLTGAESRCAVTDSDGSYSFTDLLPGSYTVSEVKPNGTIATTPTACEVSLALDGETCEGEDKTCSFGNICLGAGGGKTLGFWSNANGQAVMNDGGSMVSELQMLSGLNLRNANGTHFHNLPSYPTYAQFRTWLLNANATNMAYMLSAQLAAMALNVEALFVNSGSLVNAPGCGNTGAGNNFISIGNLMTAANTSLSTNGNTVAPSAVRTYQECLKTALDKANNNKNFVVPCSSNYGATCE